MNKIENKVLKLIKKILNNKKKLGKETILTNSFLDSYNMLILIGNLEKEFKIKFNEKDLHYKNFTNIVQISKIVKKNVK